MFIQRFYCFFIHLERIKDLHLVYLYLSTAIWRLLNIFVESFHDSDDSQIDSLKRFNRDLPRLERPIKAPTLPQLSNKSASSFIEESVDDLMRLMTTAANREIFLHLALIWNIYSLSLVHYR
jgi:hypothetical protein